MIIKVKSFAKVNLFLNVICKLDNQYHNIQTFMSRLNLADIIYFETSKSNACDVFGKQLNSSNIVDKVINLLLNKFKLRFFFILE